VNVKSEEGNKPIVIGLTGSIGMGKSQTARLFAEEGVPVFDADAAIHALYAGEAAAMIEAAYPGTTSNGAVDRAALSNAIAGDAGALARLEGLMHPLVAERRDDFLEGTAAPIVVLDIPLLLETGLKVDAVVVASAPADVQRERVLARPGMDQAKFEAMLARQIPDAEKRARADFVIDTGSGLEVARDQVRGILAQVTAPGWRGRRDRPAANAG
jgi:dephospho-CoA kinase